jgi:cytochrome c-type biogenesis protein CcmF
MIGFIGLIVAAIATEASFVLYFTGLKNKNDKFVKYADLSVSLVFGILTLLTAYLMTRLITHDFQNIYVARNTSLELPILYIISAIWAGQEGSLLFWAWLISLVNVYIVITRSKDDALQPYVSTILIIIQMFFQFVLLFASDPFVRFDYVPANGSGLNPLLQDPGMIFHPPTLFIGYTTILVPFAYAMAGLIKGDDNWIYKVRSWNLFSWVFLTLGISLGGWWAYHMLGWGGYWAWDPIENSSLMPWLTLTAFIHSVMIQEGKRGMKIWNILLPTFSFILVIYATFLTRSGIIQSIHTFGQSSIGLYFLGFILLSTVASFGLIFYRFDVLKSRNIFEDYISKETSFLFNNLLFTILTLLILLGTTFPLLSEAIRGYQVRVGPGYFNETFSPLALILVVLMGLCPLIAWRKASFESLRRNLTKPLIITVLLLAGVVFTFDVRNIGSILVISTVAFNIGSLGQEFYRASEPDSQESFFTRFRLLGSSIKNNQRRYGGYIIHLSIIIILLGVANSSMSEESNMVTLGPDESFEMGEYSFILRDITNQEMEAKHISQVKLDVHINGELAHQAYPTIDYYYIQEQSVSRPHIHTVQMTDLYIIYDFSDQNRATFTFKVIPNVNLIWLGIIVSIIGVLVAGWPKK